MIKKLALILLLVFSSPLMAEDIPLYPNVDVEYGGWTRVPLSGTYFSKIDEVPGTDVQDYILDQNNVGFPVKFYIPGSGTIPNFGRAGYLRLTITSLSSNPLIGSPHSGLATYRLYNNDTNTLVLTGTFSTSASTATETYSSSTTWSTPNTKFRLELETNTENSTVRVYSVQLTLVGVIYKYAIIS